MPHMDSTSLRVLFLIWLLAGPTTLTFAQVERDRSGVAQKEFRTEALNIIDSYQPPADLPAQTAAQAGADLADLGVPPNGGRLDIRGGRWGTLLLTHPLIPGKGVGNNPIWQDGPPRSEAALRQFTWARLVEFLAQRQPQLRIDTDELPTSGKVTVNEKGNLIQIYGHRVIDGIPVRGSYFTAVINQGNLVLFGAKHWGTINVSRRPQISLEAALSQVELYLEPYRVAGFWDKNHLSLVPLARGRNPNGVAVGQGYEYRLVWVIKPSIDSDFGHFEALVDAHSGDLLSFEDTNHYGSNREVRGGVYPVTNDGSVPGGIEYTGWPMPFDNVTTESGILTTDGGGNLPFSGSGPISSTLSGKYIRINDNCGPISLTTSSETLDFGTSGGTDCATPGFGGAGNTHSSRTGFFELNRISEMARSHLPGNSWLQQQLTANMNIVDVCNAFWNGSTVNFYRSGDGCGNTGEIAAVFDHEWGHGMDDNDANPNVSNPGEGIADIYAYLRLGNSCIGQGFSQSDSTCFGGYGDPCVDCTGVRDIDYAMRVSGQPHDVAWIDANCPFELLRNGPCGGVVHCEGAVYAEAVYDLATRDLRAAPYNMDAVTAHEVVTHLTFAGATNVGTWFQCTTPFAGCGADGGYLNYLAADDDNGDISDGTPHMTAIYAAFNRHGIACDTPVVQDSGCSDTPTVPPNLSVVAADKSAHLSWNSVPGASSYQVFRTDTDGLYGCNFGKIKVGETSATLYSDAGLQNGRSYSYTVIPIGGSSACLGAASNCASVQPEAGPDLTLDTNSTLLDLLTGDGDDAFDNCEEASMSFEVTNTGLGELTNVRILNVTPISHPETTITTSFPSPIAAILPEAGVVSGSFSLIGRGLGYNETLVLQIELTADELAVAKSYDLTVESVERDFSFYPSVTWEFETGLENWRVIQGTFDQRSLGGVDDSAHLASSANLPNQCDHVRSPVMILDSSSTLSLWTNFDIEPYRWPNQNWTDRANVGIFNVGTEERTVIVPDSGREYLAPPDSGGTCGTANQPGWADSRQTWEPSDWSSEALGSTAHAGSPIQLDIRYGTDAYYHYEGFWFDRVTVTNVQTIGPDESPDLCNVPCTLDAECDDGLFCNGLETCGENNTCRAGTPVVCADTVACTIDSCNEATDNCTFVPSDVLCDNGLFCDGAETCDVVNGCRTGAPPVIDDGVSCTVDICDEASDSVLNTPDEALCDNGAFCDGVETCDPIQDCLPGTDPCPEQFCSESSDNCGDGPGLTVDPNSSDLAISGGDGDESLDNCEEGQMTFEVANTGIGDLADVRIVSVTPVSHPQTTITSDFPQTIAETLAEDAVVIGEFNFVAGGLGFNEMLVFRVQVAANELPASKSYDLTVEFVEQDFAVYPSISWDFESGLDGWITLQGTFNHSSPGGAEDSSGYVASSANLPKQCDQIRSPVMTLSATSTLSLWTSFDIEPYIWPYPTWHDRANVGVFEVSSETRTAIIPDGGRSYSAPADSGGTCGTAGQEGWAGSYLTWAESTWSPDAFGSAALIGKPIQLDIRYGTDDFFHYEGFRFDRVTVTDVQTIGPDLNSDSCNASCTSDADCDDGNICTDDSCDPASGCVFVDNTASCDDGNACTTADACSGGSCVGGPALTCEDGNICTDDSCDPASGCVFVDNTASCDDGNACTTADVCSGGSCVGGAALTCEDGNICTDDSCDPASGCVFVDNTASCEDGNACTTADVCSGGSCVGGAALICDDGSFCNGTESCDPESGCQAGTDPCPNSSCDETTDTCIGVPLCGDGICETGEDCTTCTEDCPSSVGAICGNQICEAGNGENCLNCPADCNGIQDGRPGSRFCCGDGAGRNAIRCYEGDGTICNQGGFTCTSVEQIAFCCGDTVCEGPEDGSSCTIDCGDPPLCGDTVCDLGEDPCNCPSDCSEPPEDETGLCNDGLDNDCDELTDCADSSCSTDPACAQACAPKGDACVVDEDCCSGSCKRNRTCS